MRKVLRICVVPAALLLWPSIATSEVTSDQVSVAIDRGAVYLERRQRPDGGWNEIEVEPGGATALCTLALLKCGRTPGDASVNKALDYLTKLRDPERTYNTSLMILVFAEADSKKYFDRISRLAKGLESRQMRDGANLGGWSYRGPVDGSADNSNTHYAVLALHKATQVGARVGDQTWRNADAYWRNSNVTSTQAGAKSRASPAAKQGSSGGFAYARGHENATGSMTCAGIASLLVIGEHFQAEATNELKAVDSVTDTRLDNAVRWLGDRFSANRNPAQSGGGWWLYYLTSLRHAGEASGLRYLVGTRNAREVRLDVPVLHDWYREGCQELLNWQDKLDHFWTGKGVGEGSREIGTAFALLFLSYSRQPALVAQLQHLGTGGDGSRDVQQIAALSKLTHHLGKSWGRPLASETLDFRRFPVRKNGVDDAAPLLAVEHLLPFPVLFLSGTKPLDWNDQQRRVLKEYLDHGGFLFVEGGQKDGIGDGGFDASFRGLMQELYPGRKWTPVPTEHAVWRVDEQIDPRRLMNGAAVELLALDTSCGTGVLYSPRKLSSYWNSPAAVSNADTDFATQLAGNILAYATSRESRERLDRPFVRAKNRELGPRVGSWVVPVLDHQGGAEEATAALYQLLRVTEARYGRPLDYEGKPVAATELDPTTHPIAYTHGREAMGLNATDRTALKAYLDKGGFLFAAATCASETFSASVKDELRQLYPGAEFAPLAGDHRIFKEGFAGFRLASVTLREPQTARPDEPLTSRLVTMPPVLEGLTVNRRLVVVLSPYDMTGALTRGHTLEYRSYIPSDAARLGANVLLYALQERFGHLR